MATIKSYTNLQQSKVLAEILPIESADMIYLHWINRTKQEGIDTIPTIKESLPIESCDIPCWSIATLLDILNKSAYFANEAGIVELSSIKGTKWCVSILNCGKIENCYADEPIDACYDMIIRLNELKML